MMMNKSKLFFTLCLGVLLFYSCEKENIQSTTVDDLSVESRVIERSCDRFTVTFENLATFGNGFGPNWYAGELDRVIRHCKLGLPKLCKDAKGFEYESYCCVIPDDFDTNSNGLYEPSEQDAIIDFILQEVDNFEPSCANAKLTSIDVYRHFIWQDNLGVAAQFMCCGDASID